MKHINLVLLLLTLLLINSHAFAQGTDLFGDEDEEEVESEFDQFSEMKLDSLQYILNATGAVGAFPSSAIDSFKMVSDDCDATYICMYNTLKKVVIIGNLELQLRKIRHSCYETKVILENYALYLLSMNLDLYCIEHLHPDGNELTDVQLINAMLAISDIYYDIVYHDDYDEWVIAGQEGGELHLPMLDSYADFRRIANPYCSEDLVEFNAEIKLPCGCGIYNGTLDTEEKNKLLKDIRTIIDDINPMWQAAKAVEINTRLKALPCN
jgi:hypothetical protein